MGEDFIKEIKEKLQRHVFVSANDVYKLLSYIDIIEEENLVKSKRIKELEGDVIINANNDND